ncbi:ATP-dependent DNA helicase RecG [Cyclobacteriaceae bacterium]|nr:ATP-dependent DNA helicase RecG [Cyclobacteriaceae bacterium]
MANNSVFNTKIEFLKGVGPQKAAILNKELSIFTIGDLLQFYPFRYEDKTSFQYLNEVRDDSINYQIKGQIRNISVSGTSKKQRLTALFYDETGEVELVWFRAINWVKKSLKHGSTYTLYGKPNIFHGRVSFPHPELQEQQPVATQSQGLTPVYHTTEVMKRRFLESKALAKITKAALDYAGSKIQDSLPQYILDKYSLVSKKEAIAQIHFPDSQQSLAKTRNRLKFEELFFVQLKLIQEKGLTKLSFKGQVFKKTKLLSAFYKNHLPFDLTGAQKRVIREIREDFLSEKQMNRLLQGDVGSGKTIVAFLTMLMAIDSECQACLMAPTEILAQQHYIGLKEFADKLGVKIALLTGSVKQSDRKIIHEYLENGELGIIVGTHALLEDKVKFKNLGLAVIDEQHRFGVAQRAKLWGKNKDIRPHILVMTATPIPRTLAMTIYGDLDVSVIDELPQGRKPIITTHEKEPARAQVTTFIKRELKKGRQAYIVYPLVEESSKLDLKAVIDGYHFATDTFPDNYVSIVHGKMKSAEKDSEMRRFIKKETQIMVATTVIEVGVNVPNATVMVIENAERFGLAQLHQLRGRVGRGGDQSYCVLMSKDRLSKDSQTRMDTMVHTTNGFEIADVDMQLRGPGDIGGTQQSGVLDFLVADLTKDQKILQEAQNLAEKIIDKDPELAHPLNAILKHHLQRMSKSHVNWAYIS